MLSAELEGVGVKGELYGRPKHIYSIWNKMRTSRSTSASSTTCARCA